MVGSADLPLGAGKGQAGSPVEHGQRDRRAAWLTAVGLLPLVVVGVGLTASIYGAVFGISLLLLVARPWWAATRSVQKHRRLGSTALGQTIVALAVFTASLVVSVLVGLDNLDTPIERVLLAIAVGCQTMCWFATAERLHA
jgi:glycerol uptake facilitator-like aquaporin